MFGLLFWAFLQGCCYQIFFIFFPNMQILNLKKRYPFKCECGHEGEAAPSLMMECFQMNHGSIHCPECDQRRAVKIDPDNEKMLIVYDNDFGQLPDSCYREATKEEILSINKSKKNES
jgi:hypothetical protein